LSLAGSVNYSRDKIVHMSKIDWKKELGWTEDHIDELRVTGYAYIRQGKYEIALNLFEALNIIEPNDVYNAQTLGALYLELERPEDALPYLDKALKFEADHSPTLLNLCKALFVLKRYNEGLKLAEILENDPNPMISRTASALLLAFSGF